MMGLVGVALEAASAFMSAYPGATITSGRRSIEEQASAMAKNIATDRDYVKKTHRPSRACTACQLWIDAHPSVVDVDGIRAGMLVVLRNMSDVERAELSKHLGGAAFDVQPVSGRFGDRMKDKLRELAVKHGGRFLEREGKLIRWHWQAP